MSKKKKAEALKPTTNEGFSRDELREIRKVAYLLTAIVACVFVAFIYGYAHYGGAWVDRLDDRLGEIVSARARSLADAGKSDEAIELYRQSFTLWFEDPRQRIWNAQRFLTLLIKEKRHSEAIDFAKEMLSTAEDAMIYSQLVKSLRHEERHDEIGPITEMWYDYVKERGDAHSMALAKFSQGWALTSLGRKEEALKAHLEGYEAFPMPENPRAAARILIDLGRSQEALPLLDFVIENHQGTERQIAKRMRAKIADLDKRTPSQ